MGLVEGLLAWEYSEWRHSVRSFARVACSQLDYSSAILPALVSAVVALSSNFRHSVDPHLKVRDLVLQALLIGADGSPKL